jgi:REP element-mobilizing transposase RayT
VLHAVLRVVKPVGWLRNGKAHRAIRLALACVLDFTTRFRLVHYSLQDDHLHLVCEAEDKAALAAGLKSFQISAAKQLNRELTRRGARRRRGKVFEDRYHVEVITSVAQTKHTLNYVLNNWRKHRKDRTTVGLFDGKIDPYSSGISYFEWKERTLPYFTFPPGWEHLTSNPQSWLLNTGYKLGPPLSVYSVPGPQAKRSAPLDG